jgi:hypothetical protein
MDTILFIAGAVLWVVVGALYFVLYRRYKRAKRVALSRLFLVFGILLSIPVAIVVVESLLVAAGVKLSYGWAVIPVFLFPLDLGIVFTGIQVWLSVLVADLAKRKGRGWEVFFFLSVFVSPLLMWIIAVSLSPLAGSADDTTVGSVPTSPLAPDLVEQIKKLGELLDQGLITEQDFEAKKNDLLNRI